MLQTSTGGVPDFLKRKSEFEEDDIEGKVKQFVIGSEELEEYKQAGVLTDDDNKINQAIKDYRTSNLRATMARCFLN